MKFILKHKLILVIVILLLLVVSLPFTFYMYEKYKPYYTAEDFGIEVITSSVDANQNGIDDYTDILLGAKMDAENHPTYDGRYWDTGYPPEDIGVCTDVIWRAFKNAGYNLRAMVDQDIEISNEEDYHIIYPDSNIDFRRVGNLYVFFSKYAESLTLDIDDIEKWQECKVLDVDNKRLGINRATVVTTTGTQLNRRVKFIIGPEDEDFKQDRCIYFFDDLDDEDKEYWNELINKELHK